MARIELTKEAHDVIRRASLKRNVSMVALANDVLIAALTEKDTCPIVLNIPKKLIKNDQKGLKEWLSLRLNYLLRHFYGDLVDADTETS
jgi:hypothetical protein